MLFCNHAPTVAESRCRHGGCRIRARYPPAPNPPRQLAGLRPLPGPSAPGAPRRAARRRPCRRPPIGRGRTLCTHPSPMHEPSPRSAQVPTRAGNGPRRAPSPGPAPASNRILRIHGTRSWQHFDMRIEKTDLADVLVLVPQPFRDGRGLFTRTFDADIFDDYLGTPGISASFVQDSQSRSARGVIRGMHGRSGRGEAKLVRCAHGAVHDVLIDIRKDSPTFALRRAFLLDDNDFRHLYVPPGFLHGFQALTATADVCYRIDRPHDPSEDLAVAYNDADLAIDWPLPVSTVSHRDARAGSWSELL